MMTTMASSTRMSPIAANHRFRLVEILPYTITTGTVALISSRTKIPTTMERAMGTHIHQRYRPNCIQLRCGPDAFLDPFVGRYRPDGKPDEMYISMNADSILKTLTTTTMDDDTDEDACFGSNKWNRTARVFPPDYDADGIATAWTRMMITTHGTIPIPETENRCFPVQQRRVERHRRRRHWRQQRRRRRRRRGTNEQETRPGVLPQGWTTAPLILTRRVVGRHRMLCGSNPGPQPNPKRPRQRWRLRPHGR